MPSPFLYLSKALTKPIIASSDLQAFKFSSSSSSSSSMRLLGRYEGRRASKEGKRGVGIKRGGTERE